MPFFSIIIPVYNAGEFLQKCFESIERQTFTDYEVVIVDDGSNDNSGLICDEYAKKDARVRVFHEVNGGPSRARNKGFLEAVGKYIYCVDNDDYFTDENYFIKIYNSLIDEPVDVLLTGAKYYRAQTDTINKKVNYTNIPEFKASQPYDMIYWLISNKVYETSCWTKIIDREFLINNNFFFDEKLLIEDLDWNMRFLQKIKKFNVLKCDSYIHVYRSGSITSPDGEKNYKKCLDQVTTIGRWAEFYKNFEGNEKLKEAMLSYLCYQFFVTIGISTTLSVEWRKSIDEALKKIDYVTKFSIEKKQRVLCIIYRLFGYRITYLVAGQYFKKMRTRVR